MDSKLELLIAEINALPVESREHLIRVLFKTLEAGGVRDSLGMYEPFSSEASGMKAVTVILPDELAKRAQEAGLLSEARLAELIRGALMEEDVPKASSAVELPTKRRLVRHNGR